MKIPEKKMIPQTNDKKKPYFGLLSEIAMRRGTSPTQAKHPRSYGGKARTSKNPDKTAAKIGNNRLKILFFNTSGTPSKNCGIADSAKHLTWEKGKRGQRT